MKGKKMLSVVLAAVLCLSIVLGVVMPQLLWIVRAKETQTVRIEAENAYWNGYQLVKKSSTNPNAMVVGNAAEGYGYATWSELSAMQLNKNQHIYIAFCVDAPQAGTYEIAVGNVIRMTASATPYAAVLVNPQSNGQAYKLGYSAAGTTPVHSISNRVAVQLQKGRNMLYMMPLTGDQSVSWADADYIEITGESAVTHVASTAPVTVKANAGGYHKFATISADALAGADLTQAQGLTAAAITREQLTKVPHVSYTVEAPADGYYDISLKFSCHGSITAADYAVALLVDDRPAEVKPIYGTSNGIADISTYLTKGVHVLTIPAILPSTDSAKTVYWSDLKGLTLSDSLVLSDQFNSLATGTALEAETYAFAWRYPKVSDVGGRLLVGGSQPGLKKQTYAQLAGGEKLDKNQPMLTYQIDVLQAGTYTLNVTYRDYTGSDYYMIVAVDDTTYAKATYIGADSRYSHLRVAGTTLNLTEGRHFIRLITLPGDTQANWIDVDYMAVKGSCPVIGVKDWTHLQSADAHEYQGFAGTTQSHSSYGQWWNNALAGYQGNSMAADAGVTTDNFTAANLADMGWIRYNVHVPKDGFYDMQTYLQPNPKSSGTGKILLGIEKIDANMINQAQGVIELNYTGESSGWWDIQGENRAFAVTAKNYLPATQRENADYAMAMRVTMDNGKSYAFRIFYNRDNGYGYSRYGANGSSSGWGNQIWLDSATTALLNGNGAEFKVERTEANVLTVTLAGKVLDTYTMTGVTSANKVIAVGFRQFGNSTDYADCVEVPFEVTPAYNKINIDLQGIENGKVTTEKDSYKVGDTVVLNVVPEEGYTQKLTLNGKPILLDWATGKYSFKATDTTYDIDGSFEKIVWNNKTFRWVDVRLDKDAQQWWIADLSSYLTEGDYAITVSGLMDYTGSSDDWCDMGALTVSGGMTALGESNQPDAQLNPSVSQWNLVLDPRGVRFTFKNMDAADTVAFYIGDQQLDTQKLSDHQYIAYITAQQMSAEITVTINGNALPRTYIPELASLEIARTENLSNVTTQISNPGDLFFRNDNLTDFPDPFVLDNTARDGYYYIYGTWGAFRCFRSKNLMDWELCGEVLQQYRENNRIWDSVNGKYSYQLLGSDLWAPEVVYDDETKLYYMFFSASPDRKGEAVKGAATEQLMVATSTSPTGPFTPVNFKNAQSCGVGNLHTYNTSTYPDYFAPYLFLDPAQNQAFSVANNNGQWRGESNGGYLGAIDAHPYVAPDGTKYLLWVDSRGEDRICGVEMENWLKPKWETATVLTYYSYYTVNDWKNGSTNKVSYENYTTTNEGPFVLEHNGKYYLTYSANNWKNNSYLVAQAVADNVLGPYTKLKESEGGVVLSGMRQGGQNSSGTGHHSILRVGEQLFMIYHRHNDPAAGGSKRNHAIDEIKWITVNNREVMYVNGPNVTLQPKVESHSEYRNIAEEAQVTVNRTDVNSQYLNDGLLSHQKNGHANVTGAVGETLITQTTTFAFDFEEVRSVRSIMVYNSRAENQVFRQIKQIKLLCLENGKAVVKYIHNVPFNAEYYTTNASGKVTYVEPCAAAYAVFDQQNVISAEITVELPAGQSAVGISEIMILGK